MLRSLGFLSCALLTACAGHVPSDRPGEPAAPETQGPGTSLPEPPPEPEPTLELPAPWATQAPWDFEQYVASLTPGYWSSSDRAILGLALKRPEQSSIRAAVLLGFGGPQCAGVILSYLEERIEEDAREADAAEVVAIRALERFPQPDVLERLKRLAIGGVPHPDLEIRTECACVALDMGDREVIPFLLRVLHAGTPAELKDPIDWSPKQTLAWSKGRAAAALSRAAGIPNEFQADGPWAAQNAQAAALAGALGVGQNAPAAPRAGK